MLKRLIICGMSQSNKLIPPVTPIQTRLSNFFVTTPPPSGGKKRSFSSDSISPTTSPFPCTPSPKHLKISQTSNPSLSSQNDPATEQDPGEDIPSASSEQIELMQRRREEALKKRNISIFTSGMESSWKFALKEELSKPYFHQLVEFVETERSRVCVYPAPQDVFSWSRHCHIQDVRVVILGQDPYHGPSQAHGLCFSVTRGVVIPPSLLNIYKELKTDIPGFEVPNHGHLVTWVEQVITNSNAIIITHRVASYRLIGPRLSSYNYVCLTFFDTFCISKLLPIINKCIL